MDIRNAKAFIKYGVDETKTSKKIILESVAMSLFCMLAGVFGFFHNRFTAVVSALIYSCAFVLIICAVVITWKLNLKKRILFNAADSVLSAIMFALAGAIYLELLNIPYSYLALALPFVSAGISLLATGNHLKEKRYLKVKKNLHFGLISAAACIGAVLGALFISAEMDETGTYIFLSAAMMIISCVFSLGVLNFQKLHTIKLIEKTGTDIEK